MASLRLGQVGDAGLRAAVCVPISQVLLAGAGYVLLALAARTMPAAGFAVISAFYLLLNTIGRGVFASVELETSRVLAAADAAGVNGRPVLASAVRRAAVLLAVAIALSFAATPLLPGVDVALALALGSCTMAASYCVRGPLAARRRFRPYSLTFLVEAASTLLGAAVLALAGVDSVVGWAAVLVLSPGVAAVLVALRTSGVGLFVRMRTVWSAGVREPARGSEHRVVMTALIWTSLFYLSSQGVWNLAPVSVTSALAAAPSEAAGFVAVAVILRAPVFVFPAIQAVLLPSVAAAAEHDDRDGTRRALRPPLLLLGAASIPWLLAATLIVPGLARTVFAVQEVPPWSATTTLAASTLIGAAAFVLQTRALAFRRHRDVGLAWLSGLCVLGLVSAVPGDPRLWGALAQLAAAVVVLVGVLVADSRIGRTHDEGRLSAPSVHEASDADGSRAEPTAVDPRHA
ncbi:hypothetical protein PHK61_11560 [Actinomycetospora lutea]|uniref:hypothetical protein n=1 Tax=Actinomycetospora lutea TaxID=663604 RepID=UPI0023658C74|nr:hypothetical protein [Actinomycetospora lutea]MDD7939052.1 hypothetical protein [Actinomycetospora lutea]